MHFIPHNLRGPALMAAATCAFAINDSMMKLATVGLPPMQVLFMRGVAATLWCLPLVLLLGYGKELHRVFDRWVLLRNAFELVAVLLFVLALAKMPIADITAIGQITPLVFILGMALIMREKIGGLRTGLIALGFAGALLVAQPTGQGISIYALFGFASAILCAARDIVGRKVPADLPGWILAFCAILMVMAGAGIASLFTEQWLLPQLHHVALLVGAGFFLMFGHFCLFTAYRVGEAGSVAPFYYMFSVWALISGVVVFQTLPNALALTGIAFILASGLLIVLVDGRKRRLMAAAT
jgi:drug/metabolite transporter (DMT)-like permease